MASSISIRYADALFNVAEELNELEIFQEQLEFVVEGINLKPEFKLLLEHPFVDKREKKDMIKEVFSDKVKPELQNFLFVIIDNKRMRFLEQIREVFDLRVNNALKINKVEVISAVELTAGEKTLLKQKLIKKLNSKIQMIFKIDRQTLGGLVIRIGDRVFDGSLKHQIDGLKRSLIARVVSGD